MTTLEAPSGLAGDVRKIKGAEILALAEQSGDGPDGGFGTVLSGCWLRTTDPGPYAFVQAGDTKPPWSKLLKGDVLFSFVELRRISMPDGDNYDFDYQCEECRKRVPWRINLKTDLEVKRLSPESAARIKAGTPFETKVRDLTVKFGLQTIAQEEPITKLMKQQKRQTSTMIDAICAQIIGIEGVNADIKARWRWVADLDMDELMNLREAFDEHDCGVETRIQARCTNRACGWEQDINLPLGRAFFARPRRTKKAEADTSDSSSISSEDSTASGSGGSSITSSGSSTEAAATI